MQKEAENSCFLRNSIIFIRVERSVLRSKLPQQIVHHFTFLFRLDAIICFYHCQFLFQLLAFDQSSSHR